MKAIIALGIIVMVSGCSSLKERLADGVDTYCTELNELHRAEIRERVDDLTFPHKLRVECEEVE